MSRSRSKNPNATGKTHIEAENPARPWLDATQVKTPGGSLSDRSLAPLAAPPKHLLGLERDNDLVMRAHMGTRDRRKGSAPLGQKLLLVELGDQQECVGQPATRGHISALDWNHIQPLLGQRGYH